MISLELKGIITKVQGRDFFTYSLHDGTQQTEFSSRDFIQPGESVRVFCTAQEKFGKTHLVAEKITRTQDLYSEIEAKIASSANVRDIEGNETIRKMQADFEKIARKIHAAQQLNRHITVKFHGDADGISSALILRKFLKAYYHQQNSAIYAVGDAIRDMEKMGQHFKPLLIILDFGSGEDSKEGLKLAKAGGIEIVSIDHHPPSEFSVPSFALSINPWNVNNETGNPEQETVDGSKYPAGYLCAQLAKQFGIESGELEKIACAGDKSQLIQYSQEEKDKALVLDFVATYSGFGNGIDFYSEVLSKKELFDSILLQANSKLEETDRLLKNSIKSKPTAKADVYWFNLDNIAEKREFPNKGKITGRVFELVKGEKPVAVIGFGKKTIIFRISDEAVNAGIRANEIILRMKDTFSDFVENGGGHARAAALRVKEGFESAAIEEIIKMIEKY